MPKDESRYVFRVTTFFHSTLARTASPGTWFLAIPQIRRYPRTISGAPVSSYTRPFVHRFKGKLQEVFMIFLFPVPLTSRQLSVVFQNHYLFFSTPIYTAILEEKLSNVKWFSTVFFENITQNVTVQSQAKFHTDRSALSSAVTILSTTPLISRCSSSTIRSAYFS